MINISKVKTGRKYWSNVGFEQKKINSVLLKFHLDEAQPRLLTSKIKTQVLPLTMTDRSRDKPSVTYSCSRAAYVQGPHRLPLLCHRVPFCQSEGCKSASARGTWSLQNDKKRSCDGRLHLQGLA